MKCGHCGLDKAESDFYPYKKNQCKQCWRNHVLSYYRLNPVKMKLKTKLAREKRKDEQARYYKEWYKRNGRRRDRAKDRQYAKTYYYAHPIEVRVRNAFRYAIKTGKIQPPTRCESCGTETKVVGHHPDYNEKFRVVWLCVSCHKKIHNGEV